MPGLHSHATLAAGGFNATDGGSTNVAMVAVASSLLAEVQPFLGPSLKLPTMEMANMAMLALENASIAGKHLLQSNPHGHDEGAHGEGRGFQLFREEDTTEWVVFTVVAFGLIIFDNVVLHRDQKALSFTRAIAYTIFWILCAVAFNVYVYYSFGADAAFTWATGYLLEWMLSVDNLFVFHLVFKTYGTPDHLKHKPLFYGVIGAIFFRMVFFIIEEALFHTFWWMHIVFGLFLIYTGIKILAVDDDDDDPSQNPVVLWLVSHFPLVNGYDPEGRFFVQSADVVEAPHPANLEEGEEFTPSYFTVVSTPGDTPRPDTGRSASGTASARLPSVDETPPPKKKWRATLLVVVVICLEVTDIVFAVDSVSAIVAQIPDLYLAYTACVFAMLGLRATYFVIDELIRMFSLLKYGVAAILIFIGFKLMASKHFHVNSAIVLCILIGTIATCIVASLLKDKWDREAEEAEAKDGDKASNKADGDDAEKNTAVAN